MVAVFFEEGRANPAIATAWANMPKTAGKENKPVGVKVNASQLLPDDREYLHYFRLADHAAMYRRRDLVGDGA